MDSGQKREDGIGRKISLAASSYKPDEEALAFINIFREKYGKNLAAVIFYGSCLTAKMKKPSSFRDFFVLVDDYSPVSRNLIDRVILRIMPPNLFFQTLGNNFATISSPSEGEAASDVGCRLEAKYHFLTLKEFRRLATLRAPDHYIIGRMCKRTGLVWARDESARNIVLDALVDAFYSNAAVTLPMITEPLDFHALVISFLRTSYMSEIRLEMPEKIEQIYESEKELYDEIYGMLAADLVATGELTLRDGKYRYSGGGRWNARKVKIYLAVSKARHILRFPKMISNMNNWLEQLLGKYERTYGQPLELSEFEKRHRGFTVLKYFYKIKIAGRD